MRTLLGIAAMLTLGLALPAVLTGTMHVPAAGALAGLMPAQVDPASFGLGILAGLLLGVLARMSWRNLPQRAVAWALANGRDFRLIGWGAAFLAVLFVI